MEGPLPHILGGHAEVEIKNLKVPAENLLGGEGNGFNMGSTAWPTAACATACTTSPWPNARSTWRPRT